jgi:hypothetical protein
MKRTLAIIHAAVLLLSFVTFAIGQTVKCPVKNDVTHSPKYKIGWHDYSVEGPRTLFLAINIDGRNFNRSDMTALAHRLNAVYCKEQKLVVAILDDRRAARAFSPSQEILWFHKHVRGYYELDRAAAKEEISFSTEPNEPRDEIKIALN